MTEPGASSASIAQGVWVVRTPMPGHSFGALNSYLIEGRDRCVLIDVPWAHDDVVADLERGIRATGHRPEDIDLLLLTHYHEDHSGAAGILHERYGSEIGMHAADAEVLRWRRGSGERFLEELRSWLHDIGADDDGCRFAETQFLELQERTATEDVDLLLEHEQIIDLGGRRLEVVHMPGHTRGHLAFVDPAARIAFTGDHVFAHRRANATTRPVATGRPIIEHARSTQALLDRRPVLVLPGHEEPIHDLARRMRRLDEVRDAKLAEAVELAAGLTVWEAAARVVRRRPWSSLDGNARLAAAGELLGYFLHVEDLGLVRRTGRPARWERRASPVVRTDS